MLTTNLQDSYAWLSTTAIALREGRLNDVDLMQVAETLENMGSEKENALESHLTNLLMHLLKWRFQPNHQSSSWISSIREARRQIKRLIKRNPSLKPYYIEVFPECYQDAREDAVIETGLSLETFPVQCPWTAEEILNDALYLQEFAEFYRR